MGNPYIGEIRIFAGNFAPSGWAFCQGQLIPISQNDTLFNLIGTTYGGDGQETFGLPDLSGRAPMHQGQGPGISQNYVIGQTGGVELVTLTANQIPVHNHAFLVNSSIGTDTNPTSKFLGAPVTGKAYIAGTPDKFMATTILNVVGGNQPHENMQPFLTISFIISLFGIFPSQT
ncbi:MAG: tail fiber protein [Acidobacteriota bacterium]|nr:tail fiber protein [Acidobacteriota bacterium]